jgi:UDP-GlcNAc:undecaprenyl-phosphate GlcNAc-1-phosphate transferase
MNIVYAYLIVFMLGFFFVFSITPLIIRFAYHSNFLDNPEARKVHKKAIPLLGGVAVFISFFLLTLYVVFTTFHSFNRAVAGYLLGAFVIVLVGVIDDRKGMKPSIKMFGQLISCLIFVYTNQLFEIFGPIYISLPILLFWMIGLMNALNFLDNMDGIIAGMSGILALGFYGICFISKAPQSEFISLLALTFAGSVFGFLPHNFNPAKIFLGDAGSMFIGYFLSSIGILAGRMAVHYHGNRTVFYLVPVLMLSYAIFDISLVSIIRKREGRKITQGGKDHSTHRIGNAMGSAKVTALIVYLINVIIVLTTILIFKMSSVKLLILSTLFFAIIFIFLGNKLNQIPVQLVHVKPEAVK